MKWRRMKRPVHSLELMRRTTFSMPCTIWSVLALLLVGFGQVPLRAQDLKLEVQLVWATNDHKSPDARHKPVDPEIRKKLEELPLKWTNYFSVKRESLDVPVSASRTATLSDKCAV